MVRRQSDYHLKQVFHEYLFKDLSFLIYINDLSIDVIYIVKLVADDTSLFSIIHDSNTTAHELNKHLQKIAEQTHQSKWSFNPDLNKHAHEFIFQGKLLNPLIHKSIKSTMYLFFVQVLKNIQEIIQMSSLIVIIILKRYMTKTIKGITIIKRALLNRMLPRHSFLTVY